MGGGGLHAVYLRDGMTSADTLGYGATADLGLGPTATVNASIPEENYIPRPWNAKVSSIEAGGGLPGFAATYTWTPQQIADFLIKYALIMPAMGPEDELSPLARRLQSKVGTVGPSTQAGVEYLGPYSQSPSGEGMDGWNSSLSMSDLPPPTEQPSSMSPIDDRKNVRVLVGRIAGSSPNVSSSFDDRFGDWPSLPVSWPWAR